MVCKNCASQIISAVRYICAQVIMAVKMHCFNATPEPLGVIFYIPPVPGIIFSLTPSGPL